MCYFKGESLGLVELASCVFARLSEDVYIHNYIEFTLFSCVLFADNAIIPVQLKTCALTLSEKLANSSTIYLFQLINPQFVFISSVFFRRESKFSLTAVRWF